MQWDHYFPEFPLEQRLEAADFIPPLSFSWLTVAQIMHFSDFITDSGACHNSLFISNIIATIVAKFSADKFSGDESTPKTAAPVAGQLVGLHFFPK